MGHDGVPPLLTIEAWLAIAPDFQSTVAFLPPTVIRHRLNAR
jgi:hypothetical protein